MLRCVCLFCYVFIRCLSSSSHANIDDSATTMATCDGDNDDDAFDTGPLLAGKHIVFEGGGGSANQPSSCIETLFVQRQQITFSASHSNDESRQLKDSISQTKHTTVNLSCGKQRTNDDDTRCQNPLSRARCRQVSARPDTRYSARTRESIRQTARCVVVVCCRCRGDGFEGGGGGRGGETMSMTMINK